MTMERQGEGATKENAGAIAEIAARLQHTCFISSSVLWSTPDSSKSFCDAWITFSMIIWYTPPCMSLLASLSMAFDRSYARAPWEY
ncbi:hypothetical protein P3342_013453 [Pyrenophora teres f. teres]|nr:hypothetical protein P3342_013453 [Pyrenophora teres f. teres]